MVPAGKVIVKLGDVNGGELKNKKYREKNTKPARSKNATSYDEQRYFVSKNQKENDSDEQIREHYS